MGYTEKIYHLDEMRFSAPWHCRGCENLGVATDEKRDCVHGSQKIEFLACKIIERECPTDARKCPEIIKKMDAEKIAPECRVCKRFQIDFFDSQIEFACADATCARSF